MSPKARDLLLLLFFLFSVTALRMGNFDIRMANAGAMWKGYYMQGLSESDLFIHSEQMTSWVHWLPALLSRFCAIPYRQSLFVFTYLQFVLIGLALFYYALAATSDVSVAWFTTLFGVATDLSAWNLGMAGSSRIALPSQMAIPIALFAARSALMQRPKSLFLWLCLLAVTQPAMTLYLLPMLALYDLWMRKWRLDAGCMRQLAVWGCVAFLAVLPVLYLKTAVHNPLSRQEELHSLLPWAHGAPWRFPQYFRYHLYYFGSLFAMFLIGLTSYRAYPKLCRLGISAAVCVLLGGLVQWSGWWLGIPSLITLMPLRSSVLFTLISLPIVMTMIVASMESPHWLPRIAAAVSLILPMAFARGFSAVPVVLMLSVFLVRQNKLSPLVDRLAGCLTLFFVGAWLIILYRLSAMTEFEGFFWKTMHRFVSIDVPGLLATQTGSIFTGHVVALECVVFFAIVILSLQQTRLLRSKESGGWRVVPIGGLVLTVLAFNLINADRIGAETHRSDQIDLFNMQLWVKDHTPADAQFITIYPLVHTPISKRTEIYAATQNFRYMVTKELVDQCSTLHHFYAQYARLPGYELQAHQEGFMETHVSIQAFQSLDKAGLLKFAEQFKASYMIRELTDRRFDFPVVYQNDSYVIYDLAIPHVTHETINT